MIVVIDTSAAAEIVLQRTQADRFAAHVGETDWVIAPTLYISEIANVFWKYHAFGEMPVNECEESIEYAVSIPDDYISERALYKEAFATACQARMPVYDMLFLALARRHNAHLLTLNQKLKDLSLKHSLRVL